MYETVRGAMRYENDGTGMREISARVRIQSEPGLQKVGQLIFEYSATNEKLDIRKVRVIHPDGSATEAGPDSVQDLTSPVAREAPMYTDARQKHVTVPGLSVGDILEYDVVNTTATALTPNEFWQAWNFINDAICLDEQVELNVPRDRVLRLDYPNDISMTKRDEGGRRIYDWSSSTLAYPTPADLMSKLKSKGKFDAKALLEGVQTPASRRVLFSTFQTWEEVGRWYQGLEGDRRTVTPDVRAKADEIVKGETSDAAKARALYQWVSENIRYVSLSFGVGRYQPHGAAEVLTNRYGDCKDKATLLEALLEAEGLHADAVLINLNADVTPEVPSPLQFDHAINVIRIGGRDTWLDSTLGVGPFGYLLPQLRGKNALVVTSNGASNLQRTPSELAEPTIYRLELRDSLDANKKRDLRIGFETRGDLEVLLRAGLTRLSADQMKALFNQGLQSAGGRGASNISLEDITTSKATDTRQPLRLDARISGDDANAEDAQGNPLPSMQPGALMGLVSAIVPGEDENAGPSRASVSLKAPMEFSLALTFSAPSLPDEKNPDKQRMQISKSFATFSADREWKGQTLEANWKLNVIAPEISADQLADYEEFRKDIFAALDSKALVSAHVLESQVAADPKDGDGYFRLGEAYSSLREYDRAATDLKKATELLPKNAAAEFSLARAYLALHQDDNAIGAFQRMIEIKNDGSTLNDAAYYLGEQKTHLDVAEKWAKQAIQSVATKLNDKTLPTIDKEAAQLTGELAAYWDTLGWIKFHENDLPVAEKYIRAAWDIANYTDVGAHLGRVYQAEGKKDEAVETYAQTLALTSPSRALSDNETDARRQLASLAGSDTLANDQIKNAGARIQARRTTEITNSAHLKGTGYFILIIGPKATVADIKPAHPGNRLKDLTDVVHNATVPQSFPDDSVQRLPRAGMLNCTDADQPCKFTLMPPVPAGQIFPAPGANPDE